MSLPNHDWVQQIHGTVICHRCGVFHTSMAPLFCDVSATDPTDIKLLAASCAVAQAGVEKLTRERDEARAKITELIGLLHRDCTECRDYPTHECRTCRLLREFAEEQ